MGVQQGQGIQHWAVDSNSQLPLKNEYDGQWLQGQRHGMGQLKLILTEIKPMG